MGRDVWPDPDGNQPVSTVRTTIVHKPINRGRTRGDAPRDEHHRARWAGARTVRRRPRHADVTWVLALCY